MIYCDTSVIVAALFPEVETERVKAWLRGQPAGALAISDWVDTEVASALSIKVRTGAVSSDERLEADRTWGLMARSLFTNLPVERAHFQRAARLAASPVPALRGGDALHLAMAIETGGMATLDRRLRDACGAYAVPLPL